MQQTLELKFLDEYSPETLKTSIMSANVLMLDDILMVIEDFLRGCGHIVDGSLQVVKNNDECC
jgi:hypothetical protein